MDKLADISCFESLQNNQTLYSVQNWSWPKYLRPSNIPYISKIPLIGSKWLRSRKTGIADRLRNRMNELQSGITSLEDVVSRGNTDRAVLSGSSSAQNIFVGEILQLLSDACTCNKEIYLKLYKYKKNPTSFLPQDGDLDQCIADVLVSREKSQTLAEKLGEIAKKLKNASEFNENSAKLQKLREEKVLLDNILKK